MTSSRAVIEQYYQLLAARDRAGLAEILDPAIVVTYHGDTASFPWAGRFEGAAGFDAFFAAIADHLEVVDVQQLRWVADTDAVVVQCHGQWLVTANQAVVEGGMVNVFTVADGRITSYDVHADTDAFARGLAR